MISSTLKTAMPAIAVFFLGLFGVLFATDYFMNGTENQNGAYYSQIAPAAGEMTEGSSSMMETIGTDAVFDIAIDAEIDEDDIELKAISLEGEEMEIGTVETVSE